MADGSEGTAATTRSALAQAMRDGYCAHCGKQLPLHDEGNPAAPYFCGLACFYGKIEADGRQLAPAVPECSCGSGRTDFHYVDCAIVTQKRFCDECGSEPCSCDYVESAESPLYDERCASDAEPLT